MENGPSEKYMYDIGLLYLHVV